MLSLITETGIDQQLILKPQYGAYCTSDKINYRKNVLMNSFNKKVLVGSVFVLAAINLVGCNGDEGRNDVIASQSSAVVVSDAADSEIEGINEQLPRSETDVNTILTEASIDATDKNNPTVKDALSRTEPVYSTPENNKDSTIDINDSIAQVSLLNLKPKDQENLHVSAENISLYRSPKFGMEFSDGVAITTDNAFGAILLDDPSVKYSGAAIVSGTISESELFLGDEVSLRVKEYVSNLRNRLGADYTVDVISTATRDDSDSPVVNLTGSIKRKKNRDELDSYPFLQHKRIRDEMLALKLDRPVWTKPTLKSDFAKGSDESDEIVFNVTSWAYEGISYLWLSAYDAEKYRSAKDKYARFDSAKDISAFNKNFKSNSVTRTELLRE